MLSDVSDLIWFPGLYIFSLYKEVGFNWVSISLVSISSAASLERVEVG